MPKLWKLWTHRRAAFSRPIGALEAVAELGRGPDVVCQDQDVLGSEVRVLLEQVADALDDDGRLARPGAGEDHERPLAPFDRGALLGGEPVAVGLCRSLSPMVAKISPRQAGESTHTRMGPCWTSHSRAEPSGQESRVAIYLGSPSPFAGRIERGRVSSSVTSKRRLTPFPVDA